MVPGIDAMGPLQVHMKTQTRMRLQRSSRRASSLVRSSCYAGRQERSSWCAMRLVPDTDGMEPPRVHKMRQPTSSCRGMPLAPSSCCGQPHWSSCCQKKLAPSTDAMARQWVRCSCCGRQLEQRRVQSFLQWSNQRRVLNIHVSVLHRWLLVRHNGHHW